MTSVPNDKRSTFTMVPYSQPSIDETTLRFVHISDTHLNPDPTYNLPEATHSPIEGVRRLIEEVNKLPFAPDFILHTGDVVYDPHPEAYEIARELFGALPYPVFYLNGNHDDSAGLQKKLLQQTEVLTPFDYEFEIKGVQVVVVDSNGPADPPAGSVSQTQLERLERLCSADDPRPLIVATHHNVLPIGIPWWDTFMRMTNGMDFHRALLPARPRLRGVFHGHVHQGVDIYRDGILYSCVVSSWYQIHAWPGQTQTLGDPSSCPGFNVVTVTPTQTFIRRHHFSV